MLSAEEIKNNSFYVAFGQFLPFIEPTTINLTTYDLCDYLNERIPKNKVGLLLSSGVDSSILAKFLPKNAYTYTARTFGKRDESEEAAKLSSLLNLRHRIVDIYKEDYFQTDYNKFNPLLYCPWAHKVALMAKKDDVECLVSGIGTLSYFGEEASLHHLSYDPFLFLKHWIKWDPKEVLNENYPLSNFCNEFICNKKIDTFRLMNCGRGEKVVADSTINYAGIKHVTPYSGLKVPLDINRATHEGKYVLNELYKKLFLKNPPKRKRPPSVTNFVEWLKDWEPSHDIFKKDINFGSMEVKRWQLYKLEQYWSIKK